MYTGPALTPPGALFTTKVDHEAPVYYACMLLIYRVYLYGKACDRMTLRDLHVS